MGRGIVALALLALMACVKRPPEGSATLLGPPLVSVELQGETDYARLTLVWMGEFFYEERLETGGAEPRLVLEVSPARMPNNLPAPWQRSGKGGGWAREVDDGPVRALVIEPDAAGHGVKVSLSGPELGSFRTAVAQRPDRLVVDLFSAAELAPLVEADALSTLMEAMSGATEPAPSAKGPLLVVVDAGHGGFEPGAIGPHGVREKDVNLAIARLVASRLEGHPQVHAVLTRDEDIFLPLKERTDFANELDADLFVSVHANASVSRSLYGIETYYLNTATDEAAERLARRENMVPGGLDQELGDDHLSGLLRDLSVDGQVEHSRSLALDVQRQLITGLRTIYGEATVRDLGVKTALFYVLVGSRMPAILVETAFVSNPLEEIRLSDSFYQEEVAAAIVRGILSYAQEAGRLSDASIPPL